MYAHEIQKKSNSLCIDLLEENLKDIMDGLTTTRTNHGGVIYST